MAKNTGTDLRNMTLYSVYVRNYSGEGTFKALERDLGRIQALGTDIIWLLPIHPIGKKNRKVRLAAPTLFRITVKLTRNTARMKILSPL
ncbi:MAG: hypothetical protein LBU82_02015 [Treponema sp.]|jgi:glycosidase|nr:hypothetical protein [Treponema sp.]